MKYNRRSGAGRPRSLYESSKSGANAAHTE